MEPQAASDTRTHDLERLSLENFDLRQRLSIALEQNLELLRQANADYLNPEQTRALRSELDRERSRYQDAQQHVDRLTDRVTELAVWAEGLHAEMEKAKAERAELWEWVQPLLEAGEKSEA